MRDGIRIGKFIVRERLAGRKSENTLGRGVDLKELQAVDLVAASDRLAQPVRRRWRFLSIKLMCRTRPGFRIMQ